MILLFGKITGIHGIKGEIEISFKDDVSFSQLPSLKHSVTVYVSDKKTPYKIIDIKKKKLTFVFALDGVNSIESAKMLVGNELYIDTSLLDSLDNDTFYEAELIGYSVLFDNSVIGVVSSCFSTKASSILEIKLNDENIVTVPFVSAYFADILKDKKTIELKNIDILKSI